ncbi:hypothetical protein Tco_1249378 [Tanacetum coccineum]
MFALSSAEAEYVALSEVVHYVMWDEDTASSIIGFQTSTNTLTEYQLADMFTKALSKDRFQYLVRRIGRRCLTPTELEVLTNESA